MGDKILLIILLSSCLFAYLQIQAGFHSFRQMLRYASITSQLYREFASGNNAPSAAELQDALAILPHSNMFLFITLYLGHNDPFALFGFKISMKS